MRSRLAALLLFASFSFAASARAETPTHFTFVNGGNLDAFGFYVGAYNGKIGPAGSQESVLLNCVDFFHEVVSGQEWDANLTSLGSGTLTGTTTRNSSIDLYRKAAWLTDQFAGKDAVVTGNIHATIWSLFNAAGPTPQPLDGSNWLDQANAHYASGDYSNYYVVTDVHRDEHSSAQEFIIKTTATPEPATMTLFATGMAGLAGFAARRRKRARHES